MRKKKDEEEESDLLAQSDTEKKEAELIERGLRVEEAEAKRGKGGKEEKEEEKNYAPRCPRCNSTQVHIRIRDGAIVCHRCGEITMMERKRKEG